MTKFKVGDRARYIGPTINPLFLVPVGTEIVIDSIDVIAETSKGTFELSDYGFQYEGARWAVSASSLEPIIDLGSWGEIEKTIKWNPTKEIIHDLLS